MSIQSEFDVQRVVAAVKAELSVDPESIINQHIVELAQYTVQLANTQADLDAAIVERDNAKAELKANVDYQTEALTKAAAALQSNDMQKLQEVMAFAGASFAEKEKQKKLDQAAALKVQAAALEAEANS